MLVPNPRQIEQILHSLDMCAVAELSPAYLEKVPRQYAQILDGLTNKLTWLEQNSFEPSRQGFHIHERSGTGTHPFTARFVPEYMKKELGSYVIIAVRERPTDYFMAIDGDRRYMPVAHPGVEPQYRLHVFKK
ncbi:hypothetical protein GOV09_06965 [Candidatus Woesearchaeota archaeon]|nr:hypothetical protein [Candidatus Woesearchaeota archaeon]